MIKSYLAWREIINEHYGSLDNFDDATTIRIQIRFIREELTSIDEFLEHFDDEPAALERELLRTAEAELLAWLEKRGLRP